MGTIDMSAATAPPKKRTANPRAATRAIPVGQPEALPQMMRREQGLNGLAQMAQGICAVTGLYADAAAIGMFWPPVATELARVAEANEKIAKPIDFLIEVGPYGALIGALMPFAFQIAANHGWIDASRLAGHGVRPPAVLEAEVKTQMLQAAAEAQRAQNAAMEAARKAQAEYEQQTAMFNDLKEFQAA
jgi:hypothetical protein